MGNRVKVIVLVLTVALVAVFGYMKGVADGEDGTNLVASAQAKGKKKAKKLPKRSPTKALKTADRDAYAPGTEDLKPNEMRIVALGTGMPSARPKQAAACFLVELGNGDKFLFDIGSGCHERIAAMKIPYDYLDKVFIGHLHVDHYGDLPTFWLGGTVMNRLVPLRIWGPSGSEPKYGTSHAMTRMQEMYVWDIGTRSGVIDFRGGKLQVTEFPFNKVNNVIYNEKGVVIRSIPAVHGLDGAVSFVLEWKGLKFVYGSDTIPNKWYMQYAKGADVAIHECFLPPTLLVTKQGFSPLEALTVGTQGHTSPEQFGKVMSTVKPRLAVGYHFYNDFDTQPEILNRVRKTYDGPLSLAVDYMVWNVTKKDIRVRMALKDEEVWPMPALKKKIAPDLTNSIKFSKFTISGVDPLPEIVGPIYDEVNKIYGTNYKPRFK
jgi:ribonuclease Z